MLKRIITCLLALSLLVGVQVSFAAEKAGAEADRFPRRNTVNIHVLMKRRFLPQDQKFRQQPNIRAC